MNITLKQTLSFLQMGTRDNQEDARFPNDDRPDSKQRFFIVCDGVGGSDKGEVASRTVCEAMAKAMKAYDLNSDFTNDDFKRVLDSAYDALDRKVNRHNQDMATTLAFVCFHGGGCTMAHIGDSRIYHFRKNKGVVYISDDHTLVGNMVHNGIITPDEGVDNPQGNVITRYMAPVRPDENRGVATVMREYDVQQGDYFFICSDGVSNMFSDDDLVGILSDDSCTDEQKMKTIATMAASSQDNNTAFLIHVGDVERDETDEELDMQGKSKTTKLPYKLEGTREIESTQQKNSGVVKWIKNIFK